MIHDITPVRYFAARYLDHSYLAGPGHINHYQQFKSAGYYGVLINTVHWTGVHQWLEQHYYKRYCWTGNTIWFDDERIAVEVALRWS